MTWKDALQHFGVILNDDGSVDGKRGFRVRFGSENKDFTDTDPSTVKTWQELVAMDEDGTVTIDGISESMSEVFSYVKSLDDSSMFKEAKTKSTSTKKDNGKDVAAFEIEFKLDSVKEAPATAPSPGGSA